jgi:putative PEP-CTERM system histidine kinase
MNVGFFSYLTAFIAFAVLAVLLLASWRKQSFGTLAILAAACTAIWAGVSAGFAGFSVPGAGIVQIAELARNAAWILFLVKIFISGSGETTGTRKSSSKSLTFYAIGLTLAIFLVAGLPLLSNFIALPATMIRDAILVTWVAFAIIGLLLIEQLYRNTSHDRRWGIKHLCLGLGSLFAYDFFLFSDTLLFKQMNIHLWNARGVVNGLAAPLIAISIARNPSWEMGIHVSRQVVFHSVTLLGAGIYLLLMATVGYFIRLYGGSWGIALQVAFLFGAGLLLFVMLFSTKIRAQVRVLLSKHFFSYKHDYREEWLKFTQTLSESGENVSEGVIRAIAALVNTPGGCLWIRKENSQYEWLASWNTVEPEQPFYVVPESFTDFLEQQQWIVDIDEYSQEPDNYEDLVLPDWINSIPDAWLLIPLLFKGSNVGFVVLQQSKVQKTINWEDRDLLKTAGQQAASLLAQHQADQALLQARQFEAFNRLSAYIVHDLKNILAQQSLILSNAEKHKRKPEFVDDVIATIENSVARMTRLMEQMRSGIRGANPVAIDLAQLLAEIVVNHSYQEPVPEPDLQQSGFIVRADKEQLSTVFGHILQNAQEAAGKNGQVWIRLAYNSDHATIEIEDDGPGMDSEFIRNRLFRPFDSTKGLTGMGIGVFESRELIRALGGDIYVNSSPGKGSLFRIVLPRGENDAEKQISGPMTENSS